MATGAYVGVSNNTRALKSIYIGSGSVAHKVKRAYIGVSNKARLWWRTSLSYKSIALNGQRALGGERTSVIANTGTYMVCPLTSRSDDGFKILCVNKNDLVSEIIREDTDTSERIRYSIPATTGNVVYFPSTSQYFNSINASLVQTRIACPYELYWPDDNNNHTGAAISFPDYRYAVFFEFNSEDVIRVNSSGTQTAITIRDIGSYSADKWGMGGNHMLYFSSTYDGKVICIHVTNMTYITKTIGNTTPDELVHSIGNVSFFTESYRDTAFSVNTSLIFNTVELPDGYVGGGVCSVFDNKWYYNFCSSSYTPYSVDSDLVFGEATDINALYSDFDPYAGWDYFNGCVWYIGTNRTNYLSRFIKGS